MRLIIQASGKEQTSPTLMPQAGPHVRGQSEVSDVDPGLERHRYLSFNCA
jgi:hypothetical protein